MNITYVPMPGMTELEVFKKFPLAEVKAAKKVTAEVTYISKTRLSIALCEGGASVGVNIIPAGSEQLKFDAAQKRNMFSGDVHTAHYFKAIGKQGLADLERHIKNLIAHVFKITLEDEFSIEVYDNRVIRELRSKQIKTA